VPAGSDQGSGTDRECLEEYERSFRRAGLPLFSEDISAWEDIFNRSAPLLGLVFLGEMLGAGDLDWEGGRTSWPYRPGSRSSCSRSPS
jgi:hypothetical protein